MQKNWYGKSSRLGILGGGQLGRMFIQEAINLDVDVHILDPDDNAPCKDIATSFTKGSLLDFDTVYSFGKDMDILTVEIENINTDALEKLEKEGKKVFPQPHLLRLVQDKGLQKEFYIENNLPTASFHLIENKAAIERFNPSFPIVQKLRKGGYDGKGVQVLRTIEDLNLAFDAPSLLEEMVPFKKELSVIVARNEKGEVVTFPTVECEFNPEANLVELLFSPASISGKIEEEAQSLAKALIEKSNLVGILAVELFLTEDDKLLINEIAPRPHNSGHHTIECNVTSQFEQHLRAILNLPLGNTRSFQAGAMVNLLGAKGHEGAVYYKGLEAILALPGVQPHIYGKSITKPFRKMGHITISGDRVEDVIALAKKVLTEIQVISK